MRMIAGMPASPHGVGDSPYLASGVDSPGDSEDEQPVQLGHNLLGRSALLGPGTEVKGEEREDPVRLEEIEELPPSLRAQGRGRLGCIPEEGDQVKELIVREAE